MVEFSIVCPIKDEVDLIPRTLPSFYTVEPSEVLLCLDKPAPKKVIGLINKLTSFLGVEDLTRIIEVELNPEYAFHQAWVRRKGFLEAKYDRILTTDIDLVINKNVLKAVEMVGKDNIGLVSLSKRRAITGFRSLYTRIMECFINRLRRYVNLVSGLSSTTFTGLYAIWRPYWLDSEDAGIKKLVNPKQLLRGENVKLDVKNVYPTGEDTYLRDCMVLKHSAVYLPDIGATCLTKSLEEHPNVQFWKGFYFAIQGRSMFGALVRTALHLQFPYLVGHVYGKRFLQQKVKRNQCLYSLDDARKYWQYVPSAFTISGLRISTVDLIKQPLDVIKHIVEKSIEERNMKQGAMIYREKIAKWIKQEKIKSMLDFGCGIGQDGVYFAKRCDVEVDFADIVESNVALTKRYGKIWDISANSIFINCEPEEYIFPREYDMILANGVLHHTPKAKEIVQNLKKFLKPNGLFICMLYTPEHFRKTKAKTLEEYAVLSEHVGLVLNPYTDYYDLKKAKELFEGFVLLEYFTTHKGKFGWYVWRK